MNKTEVYKGWPTTGRQPVSRPIKFSNAFMARHYEELARLAREAAEHEDE